MFRNGADPNWQNPGAISGLFHNYRWRKFFEAINNRSQYKVLKHFGTYTCARWNAEYARFPSEQIKSLEVYFVWTKIVLGRSDLPRYKKLFYTHQCTGAAS
jgi:hypothetical protein